MSQPNSNEQNKIRVPQDSEYARPNQSWICGRAAEGCVCPLGPSAKGSCRATYQCVPAKIDESWHCTSAISQGGRCEKGPMPDGTCCRPITPCVPTRSLKSMRMQVSIGVFALAVGIVAILLSFNAESEWVSPGPLTHQHAATPNSCADCHSVDGSGLPKWIDNAMRLRELTEQSQKCMACHDEIGPNSLNPHSMPRQSLDELTKTAQAKNHQHGNWITGTAKTIFGSPDPHGDIQCATCHQEHHGVDNDLTTLTNQQCQVCHTSSFHSFANGHPEFDEYPFHRRTKIYFDHASHYGKHFKADSVIGEAKKTQCNLCHVADSTGTVMELRGFEQTCAKCHDQQITEDLMPGFVVAGFPAMDIETMQEQEVAPGLWPELNQRHAAAKDNLPPLMKLLLMSDSRFESLRQMTDRLNFSQLQNATNEELAATETLAWLMKENLRRWVEGNADQENSVARLIPTEQFKNIQAKWFPNLLVELEARNQKTGFEYENAEPTDPAKIAQRQNQFERSINHGWYLQDSDLTLRYRPTGHADPVLKQLIEIAVELENNRRSKKSGVVSLAPAFVNELFESVADPFVSGRCTMCHTIDRSDSGSTVNWIGKRADQRSKPTTHFKHGPHVNSMSIEECSSCHVLGASNQGTSEIRNSDFIRPSGQLSFDADSFKCDFGQIVKSNCSNCHSQQVSGENCLDCHNYHVR